MAAQCGIEDVQAILPEHWRKAVWPTCPWSGPLSLRRREHQSALRILAAAM